MRRWGCMQTRASTATHVVESASDHHLASAKPSTPSRYWLLAIAVFTLPFLASGGVAVLCAAAEECRSYHSGFEVPRPGPNRWIAVTAVAGLLAGVMWAALAKRTGLAWLPRWAKWAAVGFGAIVGVACVVIWRAQSAVNPFL